MLSMVHGRLPVLQIGSVVPLICSKFSTVGVKSISNNLLLTIWTLDPESRWKCVSNLKLIVTPSCTGIDFLCALVDFLTSLGIGVAMSQNSTVPSESESWNAA